MSKLHMVTTCISTNPDVKLKGHSRKPQTATVAAGTSVEPIEEVFSERLNACETKASVRSRTEELEFQIARGWLNSRMAAAYLGIKVKTIYNLKSKGLIKANGKRKLGFDLKDLDRVLEGMK